MTLFRDISHRIAAQFTGFVFVLFMVNGALFLAADIGDARRMTHQRLERAFHLMLPDSDDIAFQKRVVPPHMRDRIRLIKSDGEVIVSGSFFDAVPFEPKAGMQVISLENDRYQLFTAPVMRDGTIAGYAQIADIERMPLHDLPRRAAVYLLVSLLVSALTYWVGLIFARRSLRPAEEMMVRLEQFTQDASHELRTPLAAAKSSLDLALKNGKYAEGIASAKEDLVEVTSLVEHLLNLARLDATALQWNHVDASAVLQAIIDRHRAMSASKNLSILAEIAPHVTVSGDEALLRQIASNLIGNAVKFTPEGGTVRVTLTDEALTVSDDGPGIARAHLPHIFDRFYQADASRGQEGHGLGLAFVKRASELLGWTVSAESEEGKGSTFTVRFS